MSGPDAADTTAARATAVGPAGLGAAPTAELTGPGAAPTTELTGGREGRGDAAGPPATTAGVDGACPRCAAPTAPGDRFCEACGTDLRVRRGSTAAAARAGRPRPCPHCGHRPAGEDDPLGAGEPDDGWCAACGLRRPDGTDRVEVALPGGAAISDRGHVRARNEDAVALGHGGAGGTGGGSVGGTGSGDGAASAAGADDAAGETVAAVVCDGVSSAPGSEVAARVAADAALDQLLRAGRPGPPMAAAAPDAVTDRAEDHSADRAGRADRADRAVARATADGERRTRAAVAAAADAAAALGGPDAGWAGAADAPSSTLVCGLVRPTGSTPPAVVTVGWVGDSRAYWLPLDADAGDDGDSGATGAEPARLLTADHVAATALPGTVDPVAAAARPDAITRWLGAGGRPEPDVVTLVPRGPGALLLCSDGLWKYLPEPGDLAALALPALRRGGPAAAAAVLTAAALAAGGEDNVSVALVPVPGAPAEPDPADPADAADAADPRSAP